jgi:mannose-6-phosphate isomerase-like protein (cupin superfamily)
MGTKDIEGCHGGEGTVKARFVLDRGDSEQGIAFMHDDILEPGVTIAEHPHDDSEEVYFLAEGNGTMILDGEEHPMGPGDVSIVSVGHTHGIRNTGDGPMRLIVIGVKKHV